VCWSIAVKEKPNVGSPFFGAFLLTASLRRRRTSMYIYLFTIAVPLNYASEFREVFEATYTKEKIVVVIIHFYVFL
jgi:hypothetical protein